MKSLLPLGESNRMTLARTRRVSDLGLRPSRVSRSRSPTHWSPGFRRSCIELIASGQRVRLLDRCLFLVGRRDVIVKEYFGFAAIDVGARSTEPHVVRLVRNCLGVDEQLVSLSERDKFAFPKKRHPNR